MCIHSDSDTYYNSLVCRMVCLVWYGFRFACIYFVSLVTFFPFLFFIITAGRCGGSVIFYGSSVSVSRGYCGAPKGSRPCRECRCYYYYCYYIILHQLDSAIHCCVYKGRRTAHTKKINIFHYLFGAVAAAKGINFLIYPWNIFAGI